MALKTVILNQCSKILSRVWSARFDIFTALKIEVLVFWAVKPFLLLFCKMTMKAIVDNKLRHSKQMLEIKARASMISSYTSRWHQFAVVTRNVSSFNIHPVAQETMTSKLLWV